jgi:hypothetical protein
VKTLPASLHFFGLAKRGSIRKAKMLPLSDGALSLFLTPDKNEWIN